MSYIFNVSQPFQQGNKFNFGGLVSGSEVLAFIEFCKNNQSVVLVVVNDIKTETQLLTELNFYSDSLEILHFANYEVLTYDNTNPHQDIISSRIKTLNRLQTVKNAIVVTTIEALSFRITPINFINSHSLSLKINQKLIMSDFITTLINNGYLRVNKVEGVGEFSIKGALIDIYPMGSQHAIRIELFDDEIDELREFDSQTQLSIKKITEFELLPAKEFSFDTTHRDIFLQQHLNHFNNPEDAIYQSVQNAILPSGIEFYLSLFFLETASLLDYLPNQSVVCYQNGLSSVIDNLYLEFNESYKKSMVNTHYQPLKIAQVFFSKGELFQQLKQFKQLIWQSNKTTHGYNANTSMLVALQMRDKSLTKLQHFLESTQKKVLITCESMSRLSILLEVLPFRFNKIDTFTDFINSQQAFNITICGITNGFMTPDIVIISEENIFGGSIYQQKRRRRAKHKDFSEAIKSLIEIKEGDAIVHENYGVGRYLGLNTEAYDDIAYDFINIEYAGNAKLLVPIDEISLISRYASGAENPPLHKLGTQIWNKTKKKAMEAMRDVASELLKIYAKRELETGFAINEPSVAYSDFVAKFAFEETEDQLQTMTEVISDMRSEKPMDRLVCGDVGFGKTEISMRASFLTIESNLQVAILVPTTLLANQHCQSFMDRFSDFAVNIVALSRFQTIKQQNQIKQNLKNGKIDIVIGTHKLIQKSIEYHNLGLVIIDEEHRFGVTQKEQLKTFRTQCNILTMSATPIPRTLNMALGSLRAMSIIGTPPKSRVAVKTFISEFNYEKIKEACAREMHRGGQIFFLHNNIDSIDNMAEKLSEILSNVTIRIAHGQMPSSELEAIMGDFYHQRFQILVCTTIIETGIDIPSANTIIINNADRFGLSQLHQLRGRVGRSHHKAYAYLLIKSFASITPDAKKRLDAIESLEALGAGFMLANHDLEIRGAGDILGKNQSGKISEIGFTLYYDLLERTVRSIKNNKTLALKTTSKIEMNLGVSCIIPSDYIFDVHTRLEFYQKINHQQDIKIIQLEMIDRFGFMPDSCKNLFAAQYLKSLAETIGVESINAFVDKVLIKLSANSNIDFAKVIKRIQMQPKTYQLKNNTTLIYHYEELNGVARIETIHQLLQDLQ